MRKASDILYRFRGYILALFAVALLACPAAPFPHVSLDALALKGGGTTCIPYIGTLLFYILGIALRIRARQFIGQHTRGSTHEAAVLVTAGPYAHMRHPLYTSNTYIALGAIFFQLGVSGLFHIFIIAIVLFEYALARAEDRFLEEKFGDTWRAWALRTPMTSANIEALFCRNSGDSPARTVLQAFRADASTWFWFVFFNLIMVLLKIYTA
ncbi:MAG: isoprenylcysteine carboxylmethyltransferase family protein [Fibrobacter sp.]|uniref:methyltransferase family protein n=1 Tax=Fibrobacter sp. TaxID=35828 RepID=UPI0025BE5299|nr:isoprenylcysteine carboxylmethyltransferase family protein [Fibrobacter sp.]MBQ9226341.1 isoprenylcysteine carboxylmethyltransferase family protein [Fibrobacter sp.]